MAETTATQHETFEAWDRAMREHEFNAKCLLQEMIGYTGSFDPEQINPEQAAGFVRTYLTRIREWGAARPEWVQ